jgi:hypothetical protein
MVMRISNWVRRGGTSPAFWVFAIAATIVFATNLSSSMTWTSESGFAKETLPKHSNHRTHLEEGTKLPEILGVFGFSEHRFKFIELKGEHREFVCLENSTLERVQQASQQESSDCAWIITGSVTKFRGENFLIIDSATPAPKRTIASR